MESELPWRQCGKKMQKQSEAMTKIKVTDDKKLNQGFEDEDDKKKAEESGFGKKSHEEIKEIGC